MTLGTKLRTDQTSSLVARKPEPQQEGRTIPAARPPPPTTTTMPTKVTIAQTKERNARQWPPSQDNACAVPPPPPWFPLAPPHKRGYGTCQDNALSSYERVRVQRGRNVFVGQSAVTLTPGPWNGGILHTATPFPMESTTGKKWGMLVAILSALSSFLLSIDFLPAPVHKKHGSE